MDRLTVLSENARTQKRLTALIRQIDSSQYACPLEAGWTVSAVLAHLAFWDQRAIVLIRKWRQEGVAPSPMDVDIINETTRSIFLELPGPSAGGLAARLAFEVDSEIEKLEPALFERIAAEGTAVHLCRAEHRSLHLDQIEDALGLRYS